MKIETIKIIRILILILPIFFFVALSAILERVVNAPLDFNYGQTQSLATISVGIMISYISIQLGFMYVDRGD